MNPSINVSRLVTALQPVCATTLAMAPNAPIGASHSTITRILKINRCRCSIPGRSVRPSHPVPGLRIRQQRDEKCFSALAFGQGGEQRRRDDVLDEIHQPA